MSVNHKVPTWFWIVAVLFLLWNIAGVYNYISQVTMSAEGLAGLDQNLKSVIESRPLWATSAFAIAVWGGLIASVLLLMRKSLAVTFFIISLLGVLVSTTYGFFLSNIKVSVGEIGFSVVIIIAGFISIWISRKARDRSWIK